MGLSLIRGTYGWGGIQRALKGEKGLDKLEKDLRLYPSRFTFFMRNYSSSFQNYESFHEMHFSEAEFSDNT